MAEALRVLLDALVVASSCTIATYAVAFVVIAVSTTARRARPDPLAAELDRVLEEILAPSGAVQPEAVRSGRGRRR
jgi:hypothetical protein